MGACLSKKKKNVSVSVSSVPAVEKKKPDILTQKEENQNAPPAKEDGTGKKKEEEEEEEEAGLVKKEVFVIKHRKSHERRPQTQTPQPEEKANPDAGVRTSSYTKDEVDAILIQCGRLSRNNSSGTGKTSLSARKYSGSKRSYDFDHDESASATATATAPDDDNDSKKKSSDDEVADTRQHRQRHRQSPRQSPSSSRHSSAQGRRRRTPSRERDQQQRSGSRERGSSSSTSSGRRVSRSPGRRSDHNSNSNNNSAVLNSSTTTNRPAKMVSVPATVMEKSNNNGGSEPAATTIKRISVKRNVGAASPRSQSPARTTVANNQQQPCLSRSSSRKAEHSPYRRNPLADIDPNSLAYPQSTACNNTNRNKEIYQGDSSHNVLYQAPLRKANVETIVQGINYKAKTNKDKVAGEKEQLLILEESKTQLPITGNGAEIQKPQTLTRSRSARRSRDLDFTSPETLSNPTPSYTALLLEDIQNFHQKNAPSFSLPACVSKACSILEAVADLNSTTGSTISEDRKASPLDHSNDKNKIAYNYHFNPLRKKSSEAKEPFLESEVLGSDDLTEPSFHKYVTVRRGGAERRVELDEQESSGSNSYVGSNSQMNWSFSSSTWEPNSADSTDRWTSEQNLSESARRGFSGNVKDVDYQQIGTGIERGRFVGASKGGTLHTTVPVVATVVSK